VEGKMRKEIRKSRRKRELIKYLKKGKKASAKKG